MASSRLPPPPLAARTLPSRSPGSCINKRTHLGARWPAYPRAPADPAPSSRVCSRAPPPRRRRLAAGAQVRRSPGAAGMEDTPPRPGPRGVRLPRDGDTYWKSWEPPASPASMQPEFPPSPGRPSSQDTRLGASTGTDLGCPILCAHVASMKLVLPTPHLCLQHYFLGSHPTPGTWPESF